MYAGIVTQGTGKISLAAATRASNQQILGPVDPVTGCQLGNLGFLDASWMLRVDLGIDDGDRLTTVINKTLLTCFVRLAHGTFLQAAPMAIALTELRVAVTTVGILLGIFFPRQLLGHALEFKFLVNGWPVRYLKMR